LSKSITNSQIVVKGLKAPFPWFGGKSRAAHLVWPRLGNVQNYVEPFFGSGAVLLERPHTPQIETVNDLDCYLSNFWRALQHAPGQVARHADWPVNEIDLLARHRWLDAQAEFRERMGSDPDYYDVRVAGWWVWGQCSWIGDGWCMQRADGNQPQQLPHLGAAGMGINRKLPSLDRGRGINRKLTQLNGRGERIQEYFTTLAQRLRDVRVACGDWSRILNAGADTRLGVTGVFLDPPYSSDEHNVKYAANSDISADISADVSKWAIEHGNIQKLRIALCGYAGMYDMPSTWECVKWKAQGGHGVTERAIDNSTRERIWFSPNCLKTRTLLDILTTRRAN